MAKTLPRLTHKSLRQAEHHGKTEGWYKLLIAGYLPEEIALFAEPSIYHCDVTSRVRNYAQSHRLPVPTTCAPKRERRRFVDPIDWADAFKSSVMRTGMVLALTQPMLRYLCATADNVYWDRAHAQAQPDNGIITAHSLAKRGLISFKKGKTEYGQAHYELTPAGRCVIDLLKVVGVFVEADEAIAKRLGR